MNNKNNDSSCNSINSKNNRKNLADVATLAGTAVINDSRTPLRERRLDTLRFERVAERPEGKWREMRFEGGVSDAQDEQAAPLLGERGSAPKGGRHSTIWVNPQ